MVLTSHNLLIHVPVLSNTRQRYCRGVSRRTTEKKGHADFLFKSKSQKCKQKQTVLKKYLSNL